MWKNALNKMCCPICQGGLRCVEFEIDQLVLNGRKENDSIVKDGVIVCEACKTWYPLASYVPVMLVFKTSFHEQFRKRYSNQLDALGDGYSPPSGKPMPGERSVQETFTEEWETLQDDELCFTMSEEERLALHSDVFLGWDSPPSEVKSVLDVGCGFGQEALQLQKICNQAEVFAIDLNFSLLISGPQCKHLPAFHMVIASLFSLPFPEHSFDLVYSQGVIHHTYSTKNAFRNISRLVRPGGYLFVWVYAIESIFSGIGWRAFSWPCLQLAEIIIRPLMSRLPRSVRKPILFSLACIMHPLMWFFSRHRKNWRLKNTLHSVYDRFSPRYAHCHSFNEVIEWFEAAGYSKLNLHSPYKCRQLFNKQLGGIGILGHYDRE